MDAYRAQNPQMFAQPTTAVSQSGASGGYLLYPNKSNLNMLRSTYAK
jgi:hypothetical protein